MRPAGMGWWGAARASPGGAGGSGEQGRRVIGQRPESNAHAFPSLSVVSDAATARPAGAWRRPPWLLQLRAAGGSHADADGIRVPRVHSCRSAPGASGLCHGAVPAQGNRAAGAGVARGAARCRAQGSLARGRGTGCKCPVRSCQRRAARWQVHRRPCHGRCAELELSMLLQHDGG